MTSRIAELLLISFLGLVVLGIAVGILVAPPLIIYLWIGMTGWPAALLTAAWIILLMALIIWGILNAD